MDPSIKMAIDDITGHVAIEEVCKRKLGDSNACKEVVEKIQILIPMLPVVPPPTPRWRL